MESAPRNLSLPDNLDTREAMVSLNPILGSEPHSVALGLLPRRIQEPREGFYPGYPYKHPMASVPLVGVLQLGLSRGRQGAGQPARAAEAGESQEPVSGPNRGSRAALAGAEGHSAPHRGPHCAPGDACGPEGGHGFVASEQGSLGIKGGDIHALAQLSLLSRLQARFAQIMQEKVELKERVEELEHRCVQLSGETETIGEWGVQELPCLGGGFRPPQLLSLPLPLSL